MKLAFVGLGNILDAHLSAIQEIPALQTVAGCDPVAAKREAFVAKTGLPAYPGLTELFGSENIDVVTVNVPHGLHCEVAVMAMRAGCHVVVEKPMAVSVAQCRTMLEVAAETDRRLLVAELASFNAGAMLTGRKFATGRLGRFFCGYHIKQRPYFHAERPEWFLDPGMSGGGMFSNVGVHSLALARAALPGLEAGSVMASVSHVPKYQVEACTSALVSYAGGGAMQYTEAGYYPVTGPHSFQMVMMFEQGCVRWDDKCWTMNTRDGREYIEQLPPPRSGYIGVYENVLKASRGEEYTPTAVDLGRDVAIAQAAYESSREGRLVRLDDPQWKI